MKKQIYAGALGVAVLVSGITAVLAHGNATSASYEDVQPQPKTVVTAAQVEEKPVENPLHIAVKGPVEHYVWTHDGQRDEVWQNVNTGEWNIRTEAPNHIVQKGILKDRILYHAVYQNGQLQYAQSIAQAAGYTGKDSVMDSMKRKTVAANETTGTYAGLEVGIIPETVAAEEGKTFTQKTYVDRQSRLPLKVEVTDSDGNTSVKDSWTYEYLQENEVPKDLFAVPADVQYRPLENPQVPVNKN